MRLHSTSRFAFFIILFTVWSVKSQDLIVTGDNIKIEFTKSRKASKIITASNVAIKSDQIKKVFVKIKVKSLNNKRQLFDPNKLSLVDAQNKLRFRPTDILFQNFTDWRHFKKISKTKPKIRYNKRIYNINIEDTFLNHNQEGIKNCELPINFNTRKNPDNHIIHFEPKKLRSRNVMLYFPYPNELKKSTLYYGIEKIAEINFK